MSKEVHFVIAVDVDSGKLYIDDSTYRSRFSKSEGYYDQETMKWYEDEDLKLYDVALAILNNKAQLERE